MPTDVETVEENLQIITDALAGNSQDQREIAYMGLETIAIMVRKNQDYGSSVFQQGAISPDVSPEAGIRVRLSDKLSRINNLIAQPDAQRVSESITDTGHDASAYLLLWVIARMRAGGAEVCGELPIILNGGPTHTGWAAPIGSVFSPLPEDSSLPPFSSDDIAEMEEQEYIEGAKKRVR